MPDTTITKIDSSHSPKGAEGQKYLASGKTMSMRLWECEPENADKPETERDYETVGYVIKGKAELHIEGQMVLLNPGDSWTVPKGSSHRYKILEAFTAVESTSPPAEVHGRDEHMTSDKVACDKKDNKGSEDKHACASGGHESSENNSVAEFAKATSAEECGPKGTVGGEGAVDKTSEVSPTDKGVEDDIDGESPPKDGETVKGKEQNSPAAKSEVKSDAKPEAKPEVKTEAKKEDVKKLSNPDSSGERAPVVDEAKQVKEDVAENKAKEADSHKAPAQQGESDGGQSKQIQEIVGEIPRPESVVTSNSAEKEPEPAEHIDLGKTA